MNVDLRPSLSQLRIESHGTSAGKNNTARGGRLGCDAVVSRADVALARTKAVFGSGLAFRAQMGWLAHNLLFPRRQGAAYLAEANSLTERFDNFSRFSRAAFF